MCEPKHSAVLYELSLKYESRQCTDRGGVQSSPWQRGARMKIFNYFPPREYINENYENGFWEGVESLEVEFTVVRRNVDAIGKIVVIMKSINDGDKFEGTGGKFATKSYSESYSRKPLFLP